MIPFKYFVYFVALYCSTLYFSLITVFGGNGFSADLATNNYVGIVAVIDAIAASFIIASIIRHKQITGRFFVLLLLPLVICFLFFFEGSKSRLMMDSFLAFSIPCYYVGLDVAGRKSLAILSKWMEVLMLIMTTAIVIVLPRVIVERDLSFEYQSYSYFAGFSFSVNLFFLLFGERFERFGLFKKRFYYFISIALLLLQAAASLVSGGRGGFLLVLTSLFVFFLISRSYSARGKRALAVSLISASVALFVILIPTSFFDAIMQGGMRTFSYISRGGIDLTQTSGRDEVYASVISMIKVRPILGYGFFKYFDSLKYYPHNIFLEVLLQGGVVYLFFFLTFLVLIIKKLRLMIVHDKNNLLIVLLALWPAVELLFSASYVMMGMFWFVVSYITCYKKNTLRR